MKKHPWSLVDPLAGEKSRFRSRKDRNAALHRWRAGQWERGAVRVGDRKPISPADVDWTDFPSAEAESHGRPRVSGTKPSPRKESDDLFVRLGVGALAKLDAVCERLGITRAQWIEQHVEIDTKNTA